MHGVWTQPHVMRVTTGGTAGTSLRLGVRF